MHGSVDVITARACTLHPQRVSSCPPRTGEYQPATLHTDAINLNCGLVELVHDLSMITLGNVGSI